MAFLTGAAERPHHAYVFAGPEGSGKSIAARAFVAALLCPDGGCGACRACRLALADHHPNVFLVEPEGRDIHVDTIREEVWTPAYRTAPEPGRKVFVIREADRLVAGRGRHAAQGARGAAGRLRAAADVGPSARAARHGPVAVPRRHVHGAVRDVRRRCAGGRGSRRDAGAAGRAARGRQPGPRPAPGHRGRRPAVPRGGRARGRARLGGSDRGARGGRRRAGRRRRVQEGTEGRARDGARAVPRREGPARGRVSRGHQADRDAVPASGTASRARLHRLGAAGGVVAPARPDRRPPSAAAPTSS